MIEIGKFNRLKAVSRAPFGLYMDGGDLGEILLPNRYLPEGVDEGDELDVFIHRDSEDRLLATTLKPYAVVGEFAALEVVSVSQVGAFLYWGLDKDLFVPFKEQGRKMRKGEIHVVYVYLDEESYRIVATTKFEKHLNLTPPYYEAGDEVDLLIYRRTDLGYKAMINNAHTGVIYENEVFKKIAVGDSMKGYIKRVREDFKIDLSLQGNVRGQIGDFAEQLFNELKESENGTLPFNDKTASELVYDRFGVSKKVFKKALGALYKQRLIEFTETGIALA